MKALGNIKLLKATYLRDYIFRFEFSNGKVFDTNFKPILYHGTMYRKYLDITKFKKIHTEPNGDIQWGNWDLCFRIDAYYGKTKVVPIRYKISRGKICKVA